MIINLLDKYSTEEQDRLIEIAERYHLYEYRRSNTAVDLYGLFNDVPYWGEGECTQGKCTGCEYNSSKGEDEYCEEYIDEAYNDWFDRIINNDEKVQIKELHEQISRQITLFQEDDEWSLVFVPLTFRLMKWLNEKDITYCIIRGLLEEHDDIFVKNFYPDAEYRLLFGVPTVYDMKYAVDKMGWKSYNIFDLTGILDQQQIKIIRDWIYENSTGIIRKWDGGALLFENEIDAMAIKLRWAEYDEI